MIDPPVVKDSSLSPAPCSETLGLLVVLTLGCFGLECSLANLAKSRGSESVEACSISLILAQNLLKPQPVPSFHETVVCLQVHNVPSKAGCGNPYLTAVW